MSRKNAISRSSVNETQYQMSALPVSGFNLSITNLWHGILGRIHVGDFDYVMPHDKIMFGHSHQVTFDRIATPVISPMEFRQYNFYVCFRAVVDSWRDFQSPSKRNNFDTGVLATFTLRQLFHPCLDFFADMLRYLFASVDGNKLLLWTGNASLSAVTAEDWSDFRDSVENLQESVASLDKFYAGSSLNDLINQLRVIIPETRPSDADIRVVLDNVFLAILDFVCGEGSLLDSLGYLYFRHYDLKGLKDYIAALSNPSVSDAAAFVSDLPQNDLALRCYTAIWVEYFRNVDIEPMISELDYKRWSNVPFYEDGLSYQDFFALIPLWLTRPCKWDPDIFTGSQIDDISRHVYAPISTNSSFAVSFRGSELEETPLPNIRSFEIPVSPSVFGESAVSTLSLSLPTFGSYLLNGWSFDDTDVFSLDLHNLQLAQAAQRYLKRLYNAGDEYRDNLSAIYEVDLSDDKLNRPILISGDISKVDPRQEVSTAGTDSTPVGTRTATATASSSGDGASYFAEEFGCVFNLTMVVPRAQYDGLDSRSVASKITDFPNPLFAQSNEEISSKVEICRSANVGNGDLLKPFGYHPYAHAWRGRSNQVHGRFHSSMIDCTFLRFFDGSGNVSVPKLNYKFLTCHPVPRMFVNSVLLDGQFYVQSENQLLIERKLPTPVEQI